MADDSKARFPDMELMDVLGLADPEASDSGTAFNLSAALAFTAPETAPRFSARQRLANLAGRDIRARTLRPEFFTRNAQDGGFRPLAIPGISVRPLFHDKDRNYVTTLVRFEPGARYPVHRHSQVEECYVLEGDLHHGETVYGPGDYQRAEPGSLHGEQWSEKGCLVLILADPQDEVLS